jgi:hypothetical protein
MKTVRFASHVHTEWSDDSPWSILRIVRALKLAGFGGALVCDHDRGMTDGLWSSIKRECRRITHHTGFVVIPGVEYQDPDHVVHMPVFGDGPFYGRSPRIAELLSAARSDGAATVFAHPSRRDAWSVFEEAWVPDLAGIEVWSRKYDGLRPNEWALAASAHYGLASFVSLDFHGPRQLYPLAMLATFSRTPSQDDALAALRGGGLRPSALGIGPERFGAGILGSTSVAAEKARGWMAPQVRRLENRVLRWSK